MQLMRLLRGSDRVKLPRKDRPERPALKTSRPHRHRLSASSSLVLLLCTKNSVKMFRQVGW